ncbi:AsnC family transcriptional regulator [Candidatus Woesearchaeota archaeon]|nr:AsnC family transcriptional regulator [Candidatus Woesearchaeota archaeon]
MDELDHKILHALQKDSRVAFLQLAKQFNVTEGTIRHRVKKLQEEGVLQQFTIKIRSDASCIIEIITTAHVPTAVISQKIKQLGVSQIYEVAGRASIVCVLQAKNLEEINEIIEKIRVIKGVMQTETLPILKII